MCLLQSIVLTGVFYLCPHWTTYDQSDCMIRFLFIQREGWYVSEQEKKKNNAPLH